jgi:hypothetical protein
MTLPAELIHFVLDSDRYEAFVRALDDPPTACERVHRGGSERKGFADIEVLNPMG